MFYERRDVRDRKFARVNATRRRPCPRGGQGTGWRDRRIPARGGWRVAAKGEDSGGGGDGGVKGDRGTENALTRARSVDEEKGRVRERGGGGGPGGVGSRGEVEGE